MHHANCRQLYIVMDKCEYRKKVKVISVMLLIVYFYIKYLYFGLLYTGTFVLCLYTQ